MEQPDPRYVPLLNAVDFFAFGKLWKIKNRLWKKVDPDFVSKVDEGYHPAISLGKKNLTSLYQLVPMLLGSHSLKTGFPLLDFTKSNSSRLGFFKIRPFLFYACEAVGPNKGIEPNLNKSHLEPLEQSALKDYLRKKGVSFDD